MNELAEQIEALDWPCLEVFLEAWVECFGETKTDQFTCSEYAEFLSFIRVGAWTDAAMTLVPEKRGLILRTADDRFATREAGARDTAMVFAEDWSRHNAAAATPALALTAAALRARAALKEPKP